MIIGVYVNLLVYSYIHLLSFMSRREDLQNLDMEIEAFLEESWREEEDAETGKIFHDFFSNV